MPVISNSTYTAPLLLSNGHVQTIFASRRNVKGVQYERERFWTVDDDFLDLDWNRNGSKRIAILSHGLEGNTRRQYILGMVKALRRHGWDALAWHYRGCSGEPNKKLRSYHSGETSDLHAIISYVIGQNAYQEIALIGFSLGGNVTLKYLGEDPSKIHPSISKAIAFSVPCDLKSGAFKLARRSNRLYMKIFLNSLHRKVREKMQTVPDQINDNDFHQLKTFMDFDNRYTAPINGFRDAEDYFAKCSSRQFLTSIRIPTLLVNAKNDPFLGEACFPYEEARTNAAFFFEAPDSGGHTAFIAFGNAGQYWSETRALQFLDSATV